MSAPPRKPPGRPGPPKRGGPTAGDREQRPVRRFEPGARPRPPQRPPPRSEDEAAPGPERGRGERPSRGAAPFPRLRSPSGDLDQLEGRNVVVEALLRKRRKVVRICLDERAKEDDKVSRLLELAVSARVPVERVPRESLDEICESGVHNGVIAWAVPLPAYSTQGLLSELEREGKEPFLLLVDEISYEQNLGAILRSALGAGVSAVVVPTQRGKGLTPVVHRVAMGGAEMVPLIREGLSSSLATLRRAGVRIVGADMDGRPCFDVPMTGPLAIVLGGEGKGLTHTLRDRCDEIASVPLSGELESLNVSVTAGILAFERVRQLRVEAAR
jgi:23S rRNA (guanosine2251-2'-O)-methyltransferase